MGCPYPCEKYGKFREVNTHVKRDHEMFSILLCKTCEWQCWTLSCFLDHARTVHEIIFPGKQANFHPADDYFVWNLLAENPSSEKDHHESCESGKDTRKKVRQNVLKKHS